GRPRPDGLPRCAAGRADDRGAGPDREPPGARRRRPGVPAAKSGAEPLRLPPGDLALLGPGRDPRRAEPRHADDPAQRQGPRVQGRVHDRDGGGDLPARPCNRGAGRGGGAAPLLRRDDARAGVARANARDLALALGQPHLQPSVAIPRRAARGGRAGRAPATGVVERLRGARDPAARRAAGARRRRLGSARHAWRGRRPAGRAGRRRHRAVRRRRRRAPADARVRAAREDRVTVEVRRVRSEEELREAAAAIVHYFGREKPDEEWSDRWLKNFKLERMLAAVDEGGATVGGAGAFSFRMTVPGGTTLPTAGVTLVGVLPTHRRRGILGSMMRAQLDDVHERGEPLAALWASEETIYGRY